MQVTPTKLPDVLLLEPKIWQDERGFFMESYNQNTFHQKTGLIVDFVQDNHSQSQQNVLRGLHYQIKQSQGKLVRALVGEIFDVAVDLRQTSPTFGQWVGEILSAENKKQLWIPPGFAHGFLVLSSVAEVFYKATDFYAPQYDRSLLWSDAQININWGITQPIVSDKDKNAPCLAEAEVF
ncbi:MAG: dTDP-4-dehydrorhamnose 3,5-epimerase [Cyanobacterium sp. T60_A2020_053]|nr:dTDP-4-dehydrorhamnose 3,5-epimerase [Cyanobacterium sp. T60_A2020_053]